MVDLDGLIVNVLSLVLNEWLNEEEVCLKRLKVYLV